MKIAIIGAGSAGIFLSLFLRDFGGEIFLFEQNQAIGEKLKLTGGGKMNVTNRVFGIEQFCSSKPNLLKNLFKSPWFSDTKREELLKELGIEYKWEGDRAILKSEDAIKEVERLLLALKGQKNIRPRMGCKVVEIKKIAGVGDKLKAKFTVRYLKDLEKAEEIFDIVVVCSGGMFRLFDVSDATTIYGPVRGLGHSVTALSPALCSLRIEKNPLSGFSGISFRAGLKCLANKKSVAGEVLITHGGISGPAALDFSSFFEGDKFEMSFLPDALERELAAELKAGRNGRVRARGFLKKFLPTRIVDFHLEKIGAKVETNIADLSAVQEKSLVKNLFHFEIGGAKLSGYSNAWTTRGGVPLNEINVATLESRICPGVYFAGEVLDVNGFCGGYNVSFAMVTAKIAVEGIEKN